MFIQNKYYTYYFNIVNSAKSRTNLPNTYLEKHHIIPKSFFKDYTTTGWLDGNSNAIDNLVSLTAKEHFVCHLLLVKITTGQANIKMTHAAWCMCIRKSSCKNKRTYKITSRVYSALRKKHASILSATAGPSHPHTGRKTGRTSADFTPEWKANISQAKQGKTSGAKNPMFGRTHSTESRAKLSASRKAKANDPTWNIRPPCSKEKADKIKKSNTGKRWIHNKSTKERKFIDQSLVGEFIKVGWEMGLGPTF